MARADGVARPVRPLPAHEELVNDDRSSAENELQSDVDDGSENEEERETDDDDDDDSSRQSESADPFNTEEQLQKISFGTLKRAQDSLSRKRKRDVGDGDREEDEREAKLAALRERLQHLRKTKEAASKQTKATSRAESQRQHQHDEHDDGSDSDSDSSAPSEQGTKSRSSKHAPAAQSTRHQVSRKRTVIDVPKRATRDPRFDAMHHHPPSGSDHNNTLASSNKAYAFLRDYQRAEMTELQAALQALPRANARATAAQADDRERLTRKLNSMQNQLRAAEAREREQAVVRQHRKDERQKVLATGKTPYFLKRRDVKERALKERFAGMKSKERERAMERRKVREGQKEKKRMPADRRVV